MRLPYAAGLLCVFGILCSLAGAAGPQSGTASTRRPPPHRLTASQARRIVVLVARYDQIDISDTHIEVNSMDLGPDFIPGYASFIIIRESNTPGPDETLRRYAVNRRTGDVWEMTLCTHYDFPELTRMRRSFALGPGAAASEVATQSRELGCSERKSGSDQ
ncbi:MAG TPA: effector immunity protein Tgi2PP [Acidobacteriaceae bacterium]|nr:effector immunity protein Tgi2PP [Acidobacteriaceae bacterium]